MRKGKGNVEEGKEGRKDSGEETGNLELERLSGWVCVKMRGTKEVVYGLRGLEKGLGDSSQEMGFGARCWRSALVRV